MAYKIAGFDIEIKGLEQALTQVQAGLKAMPVEVHIDKPTIVVPASEVLKKIIPYWVIFAILILIIILLTRR